MRVHLPWAEVHVAAVAGVMRHVLALRANRRDTYGFDGDGWGVHIDGALCEMAVAKGLGTYWMPVTSGPIHSLPGDVGTYQVRSTKHPHGRLLLHPEDPDDAYFILVRGPFRAEEGLDFEIVGKILGWAGKQRNYWENGQNRPCYFVPNFILEPL